MSHSADGTGRQSDHDRLMTYTTISHVPGVPYADYEKVGRYLGDGPPEGLLARYGGETGDGLAVVAVWETKAQADRFAAERLEPALHQVHGPDLLPGQFTGFEALDVFVT